MVVTAVYTMTNNNRQRTMNCSKQTQSNPTCSELVEPILSTSGGFKRHTCSGKWCAEHTLPSEPFGEFAYLNFPERIELKKWIRKIIWAASITNQNFSKPQRTQRKVVNWLIGTFPDKSGNNERKKAVSVSLMAYRFIIETYLVIKDFLHASRRLSNLNRPTWFSYKVVLVCRLSIEFVCRLPRGPADRCNKNQPHHTDMEPFGLHILAPRRLYPPQAD